MVLFGLALNGLPWYYQHKTCGAPEPCSCKIPKGVLTYRRANIYTCTNIYLLNRKAPRIVEHYFKRKKVKRQIQKNALPCPIHL